jgi:5-methylcytosine-specific restriction endonuclease McrA
MTDRRCPARQAAIAAGKVRYFTGRKCKNGHVAERFVNGHKCVECEAKWKTENAEKVTKAGKTWKLNNPQTRKQVEAKYYQRNRDALKARAYAWRAANPEAYRAIVRAGRARRRGADGHHTAADVTAIAAKQRGRCICCNKRRKLEVDHIVPLSKGGSNWPHNLQLLCRPCNASKSAKDQVAFMQERGMLL